MSKSNKNSDFSIKIRIIYFVFFVFAIMLVSIAARWQIINASEFQKISDGRIYSSELDSLRGSIYASDNSTLAYSEPRFDMFVWLEDIEFFEEKGLQTREEFINKITEIIDVSSEELENLIAENEDKGIKWFKIADNLDPEQWKALTLLKRDKDPSRNLLGYQFVPTSERVYPESTLAAHVIGLTNTYKDDLFGTGGIEEFWNGDLNPRKGILVEETDASGRALATSLVATVDPKPGSSIYTSIDKKLQKIVEDELKKGVDKFDAESGTIIVMDPKTGEVMALANYPSYNPNEREEEDPGVYTNVALSKPYEIGSVGKVFTISAGIDLGVFDYDTIILENGHEGCVKFTDELGPLCTWDKKPQPPMTVKECFALSDNICFFEMSKMIGQERFYEYLRDFGIGQPTGIDISGESIGLLKDSSEWNIGDVAAYSYGHGYQMNAIQGISAVSAVANKGIRMKPHIVTKVIKGDGEEISFEFEAINNQERIVEEDTAELVADMMHNNYLYDIKDYEYWYQDLENYKIGWKSGTALIANQQGYTSDVNATQVGFDLSPERKFIMLVRLEKPKTGGQLSFYNSRVLWLDTFAQIKDYLQVPRK